jgi:hypothetical protein
LGVVYIFAIFAVAYGSLLFARGPAGGAATPAGRPS